MRYVEVTTQLFVFLFAQDHLGAASGSSRLSPHSARATRQLIPAHARLC
jgi:hypothetical protein